MHMRVCNRVCVYVSLIASVYGDVFFSSSVGMFDLTCTCRHPQRACVTVSIGVVVRGSMNACSLILSLQDNDFALTQYPLRWRHSLLQRMLRPYLPPSAVPVG